MALLNMFYSHYLYLVSKKQRIIEGIFMIFLCVLFLYIGSNHFEFKMIDKDLDYYKSNYLGIALEFAKIISVIYSIFIIFSFYQNDKNRYYYIMSSKRHQQSYFYITKRLLALFLQLSAVFHLYLIIWLVPTLFLPYSFTISSIKSVIILTVLQSLFISLLGETLILIYNHYMMMIPVIILYWYVVFISNDTSASHDGFYSFMVDLIPIITFDIDRANQIDQYLFFYLLYVSINTLIWMKREIG